ncbi:MAG: HesA/MoeB/ThiF family protein [Candidatus Brocadiia bacterium]|jgi:adenylyltransferase/sulfurtransferase|nr:HesA/MoeB/ThiF family protein [Candidatus Brocadiia bacterium]
MDELEFTEAQVLRYSRHILLSEVDVPGQRRLLGSSALVVGAGGLGSPALLYLAAAGVGRLGVADGDVVEMSNLQRQIIHRTADLGRSKVESARESIEDANPDCKVEVHPGRLTAANIRDVVRGYDVVIDGSDNFPTRFLVADCCYFERLPLVSGAAVRFDGQLMTVLPGEGKPCYRCFAHEPPPPGLVPSCQEAGILGAVAGVIGTLQAAEALKLLLGIGSLLSDRLLIYDALECDFEIVMRSPDPDCPVCGAHPSITELSDHDGAGGPIRGVAPGRE